MGNSPSSGRSAPNSNAPSPHPSSSHTHSLSATTSNTHRKEREPRRRESIQALTGGSKAAPASASATLQQATAITTPANSHSRNRSQTLVTPLFRPVDYTDTNMGNEQSSEQGRRQRQRSKSPSPHPKPSAPVDVPAPTGSNISNTAPPDENPRFEPPPPEPVLAPVEPYLLPAAQFIRPPRLPLPIQEEEYVPGSPVILSDDIIGPLQPIGGVEGVLPRGSSILSTTTADEEEELVYDLQNIGDPAGQRVVPTVIEWREGDGEKVYVTGTFASNWTKKLRLTKDGPSKHKDAFSVKIGLLPGQHHLKFIVDGEMRFSKYLPTTVDDANVLVNYLEVSADDLPPVPGAETTPATEQPVEQKQAPDGLHPPHTLPATPDMPPQKPQDQAQSTTQAKPTGQAPIALVEAKAWHSTIPPFLADLDQPEDSQKFARASAAVNSAPPPPSLPMFLGKSILNSTGPVRDDNSVLIIPNHTVLNHLATSSIRNGVLGVSATTRYKRKFLTTIMYKPTGDHGD